MPSLLNDRIVFLLKSVKKIIIGTATISRTCMGTCYTHYRTTTWGRHNEHLFASYTSQCLVRRRVLATPPPPPPPPPWIHCTLYRHLTTFYPPPVTWVDARKQIVNSWMGRTGLQFVWKALLGLETPGSGDCWRKSVAYAQVSKLASHRHSSPESGVPKRGWCNYYGAGRKMKKQN